ncbi:MAG: SIMPL domain-containing protein [Cyclobacteriaceae bacterium]
MKKMSFLIVLIFFVVTAHAQETKPEHFIEVTGTAELEVTPNEIYLTIRLKEFEEGRVKTTLETIDKSFLNALREAGIDTKNLELADAGLLLGGRRRDRDVFREKTYQLKLSSAAEVEKFLNKIESVKIDYVDIVRVGHSELDKIELDLKIKALLAAKVKAEALLKGVGAELGKAIKVYEIEIYSTDVLLRGKINPEIKFKSNRAFVSEPESVLEFRKFKLQAKISAQFEIK